MQTGYEDTNKAKEFGFPYVVLRHPRPYDTTTLNYNWQVWGTSTFSLYTTVTDRIDAGKAKLAVNGILNFMNANHIIQFKAHRGFLSEVIHDTNLLDIQSTTAGILKRDVKVDDDVFQGQQLAQIVHPYTGDLLETVYSPADGKIFFEHDLPLICENTVLFRLINLEI